MTSTTTTSATSTADQARIAQEAGATGAWRLHAAGSDVAFDVKKFWGLVTVHGSFAGIDGRADVGADGSVTGTLSIEASTIDTGQSKRDEHLRGADFFDVEQFPRIEVRVDRLVLGDATAGTATGTLTVRGTPRPVSFDVHVAFGPDGRTALVSGGLTVDRRTFGIDWSPLRMAAFDAAVSFRLEFRADAA